MLLSLSLFLSPSSRERMRGEYGALISKKGYNRDFNIVHERQHIIKVLFQRNKNPCSYLIAFDDISSWRLGTRRRGAYDK